MVVLGDVLTVDVRLLAIELAERALAVQLDVTSDEIVGGGDGPGERGVRARHGARQQRRIMRRAGLEETTLEQYREVVEVNQIGPLLACARWPRICAVLAAARS